MGVSAITSILLLCSLSLINATLVRRSAQPQEPPFMESPVIPAAPGYVPGELLAHLLSVPARPAPTKRQWCMKGMTYNHVIGACTLSFAAMRGRGRM